MDTKQKKPAAPRRPASQEAPRKRPAQPGPEYKRQAPQGASVYGAPTGGGRSAAPTAPRQKKKQQSAPGGFQLLVKRKGKTAKSRTGGSRERVVRAQRQMEKAPREKKRGSEAPAVIYTDPKPFNRNKLLIQLMTVAAFVLALVLCLSVFFKVEVITVSGAETYSAWSVSEASGINIGDGLLTFSRARASAQIRAELSYVDKVRIGIKLPDTVNIYIEELDVAYSVQDQDGIWWLITSEGRILEKTDSSSAKNYTQILGVALETPQVGGQATAVEAPPPETQTEDEIIPVTVTGAQRLSAALQILQALEANDIVGEAASVNVTSVNSIELWIGTRYQVNLGDTTRLEEKVAMMTNAVAKMEDYNSGMLDISFTTWADQVGFTPFQD